MKFDASEYKVEDLPSLSPEDAAKPEAKYYLAGRAEITDPDILKAMAAGNPLDPSEAIYPTDFISLIQPGAKRPKIGYCILPEGIGYSFSCADLPNVTFEMENWFMPWIMMDNKFRYRVWYPGAHDAHYDNYAIEDFGEGMVDVVLGKRPDMATMGLPENPLAENPKLLRVMGRNAWSRLQSADPSTELQASCIVHMIFEGEGGGLVRYCFNYLNAHFEDGRLKHVPCKDITLTEENPRGMMVHLMYEYTTQGVILPQLYKEFGSQKIEMTNPPYPEDKLPLLREAGLIS